MKTRFAFNIVIILMLVALVMGNSFAYEVTQLSAYDPDDHYFAPADFTVDGLFQSETGAAKAGTNNVPILQVHLDEGETLDTISVIYLGTRLSDIGQYVAIYESTNKDMPMTERDIKTSGSATLPIPGGITAGPGGVDLVITLDILGSALTGVVDLAVTESNLGGPSDPAGFSKIDKTSPLFQPLPPGPSTDNPIDIATPWYDKTHKVLMLSFQDGPGDIPEDRLNVIDLNDDDRVVYKVDLSKIRLAYGGDDNKASLLLDQLGGATLVWWDGTYDPDDEPNYIEIPAGICAWDIAGFPGEAAVDDDRIWLKVSPAQDAHIQNEIIPRGTPEVDIISGAVTDLTFDNPVYESNNIAIGTRDDT